MEWVVRVTRLRAKMVRVSIWSDIRFTTNLSPPAGGQEGVCTLK